MTKTVAFLHASVAYPNYVGLPSLVLTTFLNQPLLIHVLTTLLNVTEIEHVVLITSDHEADDQIAHHQALADWKNAGRLSIERIHADQTYSFAWHKKTFSCFSTFPYVWDYTWGLFACEGFKKLTARYGASYAVLIEASNA